MKFPWPKPTSVYDSRGPRDGGDLIFDIDGFQLRVAGLHEKDGINTGRRRYLTVCLTCEKVLHKHTTAPDCLIYEHLVLAHGYCRSSMMEYSDTPTCKEVKEMSIEFKPQLLTAQGEGWSLVMSFENEGSFWSASARLEGRPSPTQDAALKSLGLVIIDLLGKMQSPGPKGGEMELET